MSVNDAQILGNNQAISGKESLPRRKYTPPILSRYGTLEDLTKNTNNHKNGDDGQGTGCGKGSHFKVSCAT